MWCRKCDMGHKTKKGLGLEIVEKWPDIGNNIDNWQYF